MGTPPYSVLGTVYDGGRRSITCDRHGFFLGTYNGIEILREVEKMNQNRTGMGDQQMRDRGKEPLVVDIDCLARRNQNYRMALWTGTYLQITLMCIPEGGDIGLEMHSDVDQMLYVVEGNALVKMGKCKDAQPKGKTAGSGCAIVIPACTWHNVINTGNEPLKLYSVYAPPQHPFGTVHKTKQAAAEAERWE